ncbi:MAG: WecB/TagA/CpsF family glycosyltransferase, partial [Patescibacteria group bacterium]
MSDNFIEILNVKISTLSKVEILDFIKTNLIQNKKTFIATPNPEFLLEANKNETFKNILNNTSLNTPDGIGIIYASKILNTNPKIKERIAGSDLTLEIIKVAKELNKKIFLLGGNSEEQLKIVRDKIGPDIVSGFSTGLTRNDWSIDYKYNNEKNLELLNNINNSNAEIVFVAFGAPKQEYWINENINNLKNI